MFITLIAVVVALVLGHVAPGPITAMRQYHWYAHWLRALVGISPKLASGAGVSVSRWP